MGNLNEVMPPNESPEQKAKRLGIPLYGKEKPKAICPHCGKEIYNDVPCGRPDCPVGKHILLND